MAPTNETWCDAEKCEVEVGLDTLLAKNGVIVPDERHLKRSLRSYFTYCHEWRPHRSLEMDSPEGRPAHSPELGEIIEFPAVHGLHHYYLRKAA